MKLVCRMALQQDLQAWSHLQPRSKSCSTLVVISGNSLHADRVLYIVCLVANFCSMQHTHKEQLSTLLSKLALRLSKRTGDWMWASAFCQILIVSWTSWLSAWIHKSPQLLHAIKMQFNFLMLVQQKAAFRCQLLISTMFPSDFWRRGQEVDTQQACHHVPAQ